MDDDARTLWITGLCCGACRKRLTAALLALRGVCRVEVDLQNNEASVWGAAPRAELEAAVHQAGFGVSRFPVPEQRGAG